MNILEELDELFDLAERDEQWHIRECILQIRKAHARRVDPDDIDPSRLQELHEDYEHCIQTGIPREFWPRGVLNYEAYERFGNVMGSGGDSPWAANPIRMDEPEEWGLADVYPITGTEDE